MIYYIISIALHASVMLLFTLNTANNDNNRQSLQQNTTSFNIIDQSEAQKVTSETEKVPEAPKMEPEKKKKCDKWYGGVGVIVSYTTNGVVIDRVYSGYPAAAAGLQAGDQIIDASSELLGEPETPVYLKIVRNGKIYNVTVIRGEICYGDTGS